MIRSRSDVLRFEVLKLLNESPNHGYGLFLMLKDDEMVKRPSDLYKILDSMKKNKLIKEKEKEESEQGPDKIILTLTDNGIGEYYECIFESAKIIIDFLLGLNFGQATPLNEKLRERIKEELIESGKNIFLDISSDIPVRFQVEVIKQYLVPMNIGMNVYLQVPQEVDRSIYRPLAKTEINLQILDENVGLKTSTIDYIFTLGGGSKREFEKKIQTLINFLKKDGLLVIITNTRQNPEMNKMFADFAQTIFNTVPKKFHQKLFELIPRRDFKRFRKPISVDKIKEILQNQFEELEVISEFEDIEIMVGRRPKIKEQMIEQFTN
jgi:DNA-binding PadR family transcriptional regulator